MISFKNQLIKIFSLNEAQTEAVQKFAEIMGDDRSEEVFDSILDHRLNWNENYSAIQVMKELEDEIHSSEYQIMLAYSLDGGDLTEAEVKEWLGEFYSAVRVALK